VAGWALVTTRLRCLRHKRRPRRSRTATTCSMRSAERKRRRGSFDQAISSFSKLAAMQPLSPQPQLRLAESLPPAREYRRGPTKPEPCARNRTPG
jgi:hypothetical protein